MLGKRCFIAGAGEYSGLWLPGRDDFVIAADAGYTRLVERGIVPDLVVGDFDSLGAPPEHPNIALSPVEKDDTDMMLAVRQGLALGFKSFVMDGGLGGRLDQTLANFQILAFISRNGATGILLGREMCATAVTNGTVRFMAPQGAEMLAPGGKLVSVFCAGGKAEGVTLEGLKYPLYNATLVFDCPLGVSNEFTECPASVSVRDGTLIVIWAGGPGRVES